MSSQRRKRALPAPISSSGSEGRSRSRQRDRSSSLTTNESIDRLTAVMTTFFERTEERERPSAPTMRGDVVPVFNPEHKGQTVAAWCQKVDELREIFKWSEEATIYFAMSKLQGLAEVWYRGLPSLKFTWEEWKAKLEEGFPSRRDYHTDLQDMMNRRKRYEETYATYFYEKMALLNRLAITGSNAVSCIIGGISDNVVKTGAAAADYQTPEKLYGYLSNVENLPGTSKSTDYPSKYPHKNKLRRVESDRFQKNTNSQRSAKLTCFKCHKVGHTATVCKHNASNRSFTQALEKRCNFCRRMGHLEEECFQKKRSLKPTI